MTTSPPPSDVGALLAALRHEVRARRLAQAPDAQNSALDQQLARCAEQLEITRVVSAHWPLEARTPLARAQNLLNKLVRRALRWYVNPIVEQQNAFNDVAARTLRLLVDAYSELRIEHGDLKNDTPGDEDDTAPHGEAGELSIEHGDLKNDMSLPDNAAFLNSQFSVSHLQRAISERGATEPLPPLADLDLPPLGLAVADRAAVHAHWDLGRGIGPAAQRLVRRYGRWLINPIVEQQNTFNTALAAFIPPLIRLDAEMRARVATRRWQQRRHGDTVTR